MYIHAVAGHKQRVFNLRVTGAHTNRTFSFSSICFHLLVDLCAKMYRKYSSSMLSKMDKSS